MERPPQISPEVWVRYHAEKLAGASEAHAAALRSGDASRVVDQAIRDGLVAGPANLGEAALLVAQSRAAQAGSDAYGLVLLR